MAVLLGMNPVAKLRACENERRRKMLAIMSQDPWKEWYATDLAKATGHRAWAIHSALARYEKTGVIVSYWGLVEPNSGLRARRVYRWRG